VLYRLDDLEHTGGYNPLYTLVLAAPAFAEHVLISGAVRGRHGRIPHLDISEAVAKHRKLSRCLWQQAGLL